MFANQRDKLATLMNLVLAIKTSTAHLAQHTKRLQTEVAHLSPVVSDLQAEVSRFQTKIAPHVEKIQAVLKTVQERQQ